MPDFPGTGSVGGTMPSVDPGLPSALATAYASRQQQAQVGQMQQTAMMTGQINQAFANILTELRQMADNAQTAAMGTGNDHSGYNGHLDSAGANPSGHTAPSTSRLSRLETRLTEGAALEEVHHLSYQEGKSASMKSIAQKASGKVASYFSNKVSGWSQDVKTNAWVHTDPMTDTVDRTVKPGDRGFDHLSNSISRSGRLAGGLTKLASGGGMAELGSLGAIATKVAGPIGMAVGIGHEVISGMESQYSKGADYRGDFGQQGTGNFSASDRMAEFGASLQGWGTIGGARARDQFKQASSMGLRGQRRDDATGFSTDMFMKFGIDTSQSMQMVQQAIDGGNLSLTEYSKSITDVSAAAVAAGKASKGAIADFMEAQKVVSQNVVAGTAGLKVTSGLSKMVSGLDNTLQTSMGGTAGFSRMLTDKNVSQLAALSGQNPNIAVEQLHNPTTAAKQAGDTFSQFGRYLVRFVAGQLGWTEADLRSRIQAKTGGKMPANPQEVFLGIIGGNKEQAGVILRSSQAFAQNFGMNISETQFYSLLFEAALGRTDQMMKDNAAQDKKDVAGSHPKTLTAAQAKKQLDATDPSRHPMAPSRGPAPQYLPTSSRAEQSYLRGVAGGGKGDPLLESLLNHADKVKEASHLNFDETKFRIMDQGKAKDLTFAQISGNPRYKHELYQKGAGIVSNGTNDLPTSIEEITGKIAPPGSGKKGPTTSPGDWATPVDSSGRKLDLTDRAAKVLKWVGGGPTDAQRVGVPATGRWDLGGMFSAGSP